jgi:hypothetical protein
MIRISYEPRVRPIYQGTDPFSSNALRIDEPEAAWR